MQFAHTWKSVLDKNKTQTSRIVKPGEYAAGTEIGKISAVATHNKQALKWKVGNTYAVQPGRGQKAVARIRILGIGKEDVRGFSRIDGKAEGFNDEFDFWETWCSMHDKHKSIPTQESNSWGTYLHLYALLGRPAELYQAWVINFELVS